MSDIDELGKNFEPISFDPRGARWPRRHLKNVQDSARHNLNVASRRGCAKSGRSASLINSQKARKPTITLPKVSILGEET